MESLRRTSSGRDQKQFRGRVTIRHLFRADKGSRLSQGMRVWILADVGASQPDVDWRRHLADSVHVGYTPSAPPKSAGGRPPGGRYRPHVGRQSPRERLPDLLQEFRLVHQLLQEPGAPLRRRQSRVRIVPVVTMIGTPPWGVPLSRSRNRHPSRTGMSMSNRIRSGGGPAAAGPAFHVPEGDHLVPVIAEDRGQPFQSPRGPPPP